MKVNNLTVIVKYEVGIGDIEIPQKVYEQLVQACEKGHTIEPNSHTYDDAEIWLNGNIKESDCFEWECEINNISPA